MAWECHTSLKDGRFPRKCKQPGWLAPTYLSVHQGDVKFLRAREWISDFISEVMLNTWPEACRFRQHHPHDAVQARAFCTVLCRDHLSSNSFRRIVIIRSAHERLPEEIMVISVRACRIQRPPSSMSFVSALRKVDSMGSESGMKARVSWGGSMGNPVNFSVRMNGRVVALSLSKKQVLQSTHFSTLHFYDRLGMLATGR
jgi:hypothetical protein